MRSRPATRNGEPRQVKRPKQIRHPNLSEDEKLFVWLHSIIGMTQAEAYKIAFKSNGTLSSCSAMGSRMLKEEFVREYIDMLDRYYENFPLEIKL